MSKVPNAARSIQKKQTASKHPLNNSAKGRRSYTQPWRKILCQRCDRHIIYLCQLQPVQAAQVLATNYFSLMTQAQALADLTKRNWKMF
jgi:hypothetical protein